MNMDDQVWYVAGSHEGKGFLLPDYELVGDETDSIGFGPLSRINIFVGANNSGKSRLMRRIFSKGYFRISNLQKNNAVYATLKIDELLDLLKFDGLALSYSTDHFSERGLPWEIQRFVKTALSGRQATIDLQEILTKGINSVFTNPIIFWDANQNAGVKYELQPDISTKVAAPLEASVSIRFKSETIDAFNLLKWILKGDFRTSYQSPPGYTQFCSKLSDLDKNTIREIVEYIQEILSAKIDLINPQKAVYIPILRNMQRLWHPNKLDGIEGPYVENADPRIFETSTIKNYRNELSSSRKKTRDGNGQESSSYFMKVSNGQQLYHEIIESRNGDRKKRHNFELFEDFLSKQFFSGKKVDIIARIGNLADPDSVQHAILKQSVHVNIDGEEHQIHNLGDGIQALIMLIFPIFMAEDESTIYIEEPELNLHPGMQRIFLDVITNNGDIKKKNLKFFITTHSNHFLDLTLTENAPVSIFSFRKIEEKGKASNEAPRFVIQHVESGDNSMLRELGVQNSSVFIGNCSIWVEGITDRKYIRLFLDAYGKAFPDKQHYLEDIHYVFFEYAGSNLMHYSFEDDDVPDAKTIKALRLSNRIMVIADKDDKKGKKHSFFEEMQGGDFKYKQLSEAREIENLLTQQSVSKAIPIMFPKLKDLKPQPDLSVVKPEDFKRKSIFTSIVKSVGKDLFQQHYPTAKKFITLPSAPKGKLCDYICSNKKFKWDDMTPEAQELTKEIYQFIEESNLF